MEALKREASAERTRLACWFGVAQKQSFPSNPVRNEEAAVKEKSATARTRSPAREMRALPKPSACGSSPVGRTLFDKRLDAFERSFVHHIAGHGLTRCFIRGCDAQFGLPVKKFFADCHRSSRFADDCANEFFEFGIELLGFGNAVNQAARLRFVGVDEFAGNKHLERLLAQNVS